MMSLMTWYITSSFQNFLGGHAPPQKQCEAMPLGGTCVSTKYDTIRFQARSGPGVQY